jgi:menaquinol-cytochrome c reductase iron-sulfur subunit
VIGGCGLLTPFISSTVAILEPLRGGRPGVKARLVPLAELPADGSPLLVSVVAERIDAWTKHPAQPIGSVFLSRLPDGTVQALHSACPHFGCVVQWTPEKRLFACPCHDSTFAPDGALAGVANASPRALDALVSEVRDGVIWVTFQNFKPNQAEQIAA